MKGSGSEPASVVIGVEFRSACIGLQLDTKPLEEKSLGLGFRD